MRWLLARVSVMVVVLSVMVAATRALGGRSESMAKTIFDESVFQSPKACWRNICPSRTTFGQATNVLHNSGASVASIQRDSNRNQLSWLLLPTPSWFGVAYTRDSPVLDNSLIERIMPAPQAEVPFLLGDVLALLGNPVGISDVCRYSGRSKSNTVYMWLSFKNGLYIQVHKFSPNLEDPIDHPLDPHNRISYVSYGLHEGLRVGVPLFRNIRSWSGFNKWIGEIPFC